MLQILREDGSSDTSLEPPLRAEQLLYLYELMVLVRCFDEKALLLQRMGRTTLHGPCVGQEACHVGSGYALAAEDWVFPYFREPGVLLMRGMPLKTVFAQMFGNAADLCKGHNMPCQWANSQLNVGAPSGPIGAKLPVAVGVALAMKLKGTKHVTLLYMGDGATSQPAFHAAMNFAGVYKTPMIFLCQNNQYAISTPVQKQTASATLAVKAEAYGFEGIRVDGNDILAVYAATRRAVEKARRGDGPTFIEAVTYRLGPHSTSDDPRRYRSDEEVEAWRLKDPVKRFRLYLEAKSLWSEAREKQLHEKIATELNAAVKEAEKAPEPPVEWLFTDVYATLPANLVEQLAECESIQRGKRDKDSSDVEAG